MSFLKRLFGKKEEPVELPPEFLQENPPDWLIEMTGQMEASRGAFSIRVQIAQTDRTGTAEIVLLPGAPGGEPRSTTCALGKTELDRLLVILGFSFPADIASVAGEAAATITIHRHEPYAMGTGTCDLAEWIDSRKPGPPLVEIGRILIEIQRRALP